MRIGVVAVSGCACARYMTTSTRQTRCSCSSAQELPFCDGNDYGTYKLSLGRTGLIHIMFVSKVHQCIRSNSSKAVEQSLNVENEKYYPLTTFTHVCRQGTGREPTTIPTRVSGMEMKALFKLVQVWIGNFKRLHWCAGHGGAWRPAASMAMKVLHK